MQLFLTAVKLYGMAISIAKSGDLVVIAGKGMKLTNWSWGRYWFR